MRGIYSIIIAIILIFEGFGGHLVVSKTEDRIHIFLYYYWFSKSMYFSPFASEAFKATIACSMDMTNFSIKFLIADKTAFVMPSARSLARPLAEPFAKLFAGLFSYISLSR